MCRDNLRIRRIWHLPRAQPPAKVTAENVQTYLSSTASSSTGSPAPEDSILSSDRSIYRTNYEVQDNGIVNNNFFKELDRTMGMKLGATIARPDTHAIISSLPTVYHSSSSGTIDSSTTTTDDPIDELDAIIDDEDIAVNFHDDLDELFADSDIVEVINPNLKLPRPQMDSKPTGLFSVGSVDALPHFRHSRPFDSFDLF